MQKNIQTQNADLNLIKKFLDYANCADASYALLEYIKKNKKTDVDDKVFKADNLTIGDKLDKNIKFEDKKNNISYTKLKDTNTAYACAIEARFQKDKIIRIEPKLCIPLLNICLSSKDIKIDNDITKVSLDDKLSQRTIDFVNRFKILHHKANTDSGFSATLFEDIEDNNQKIFAIRGTELPSGIENDALDAGIDLMNGKLPSNQYIDMIRFYCECINKQYITQSTPLIIAGHSLGGVLAQLLTLSLATSQYTNNIKEVYTFNSPGAKDLRIADLGNVYEIDSTILNAKDKEGALFKKIRGYKYGDNGNFLRDSTLIGRDSELLNQIQEYFSKNKNLKESYMFLRTFVSAGVIPMRYGATIT